MKQNILYFLFGVAITISLAATVGRELILVEPVAPISTIVIEIKWTEDVTINTRIKPYLDKGYILRNIVAYSYNGRNTIIILDKY